MKEKGEENRRSFLKHILAGTVGVVGTAAMVKPAKAKTTQMVIRPGETLYHESENFRKYYKTLRS